MKIIIKGNLEWTTLKGQHTWDQAVAAAAEEAGDGWRLPTVPELIGLLDFDQPFPQLGGERFWSSSPYAYNANYAWFVDFNYGYVDSFSKVNYSRVRLVRAGQ